MDQHQEFQNLNEMVDIFSGIKLKKIQGFEYSPTNIDQYRTEIKEKGFVLLRNMIKPEKIDKAVRVVDSNLLESGHLKLNEGEQQFVKAKSEGILLTGFKPVTHHKDFLQLVEGEEFKQFFHEYFGEEPFTLDTKWLRVFGNKEATSTHTIQKAWRLSPKVLDTIKQSQLVNQGISEGTLALCENSFKMDINEKCIENEEVPESFQDSIDSSSWLYSEYKVGDVLIFDIKTIHGSFRNDSKIYRKNTDTAWLPKSIAEKHVDLT